MKQRFLTQKSASPSKNILLSMGCFAAAVALFLAGISRVSDKADAREAEVLKQAVNRGIAHCYAIEGSYPESLQYLKDHYGLTYNEENFFVDYQVLGSNILPDVTIIDRRGDR